MRYARLFVPYRGYWDIQVDLNSIEGGYHGYQYSCIVVGSGALHRSRQRSGDNLLSGRV